MKPICIRVHPRSSVVPLRGDESDERGLPHDDGWKAVFASHGGFKPPLHEGVLQRAALPNSQALDGVSDRGDESVANI
jgi:hypothetical protein